MNPETPPTSLDCPPLPEGGPIQDTPEKPEKGFNEAAYLQKIASGAIPFEPSAGHVSAKVSYYTKALTAHLSRLLNLDQKEVMTLAMTHYVRSLTDTPLTSLNDLGVLTQGMQLSLQDLTLEVMEYNELAVSVANQEAISGIADKS